MSHIRVQTSDITDLICLGQAGDQLNLQLNQYANQFRSYGGEMHKCSGKLSLHDKADAYEVGIEKNKDGTYNLLYDSYQGGKGLMKAIGKDAVKLRDEYNAAVAIKTLARQGMRAVRQVQNGVVMVVAQ